MYYVSENFAQSISNILHKYNCIRSRIMKFLLSKCSFSLLIVRLVVAVVTIFAMPSLALPVAMPLFRTQVFADEPISSPQTSPVLKDLKAFVYNQTLDHFTYTPESYSLFSQRYYVKDTYWGGKNSPIFVYFGDEQALDLELGGNIGFLEEHAPSFKALIIYIEHRFYGASNPLGSMEASLKNPLIRGYFDSAQALADFAEIILYLKKQYSAEHSPVIVFGVSYAGMLAAWFQLKYPHIAVGALASSAPVLQHVISTDTYLQLVTKDYRDTSESCYRTIKESWTMIEDLGSSSEGVSIINQKLKTCSPLSFRNVVVFLFTIYTRAAQYDFPPYNPVATLCKGIDGAPEGADALEKVFAGLNSLFPKKTCISGNEAAAGAAAESLSDTTLGWAWQRCSDLVYFEQSVNSNDTTSMFPWVRAFDLEAKIQRCKAKYGVLPRPNWIETNYGGQDIKLALKNFGSNIIFSNGLRDPFSGTGVLEDLSDTLLAVHAAKGAHGLDMRMTLESDPEWLIEMRTRETEIIERWITQYVASSA